MRPIAALLKDTYIFTYIAFITILLSAICPPVIAQNSDDFSARADSAKILRSIYHHKDTWEYIVDAPGEIVYFPFKIVFSGTREAIEFSQEQMLITRIRSFFISDDGLRGVYPTYTARSGGGAKFFIKAWKNPGSKIKLTTTVGMRSRQKYELKFQNLDLFDGRLSADFTAGYQLMSDEKFYGIGKYSEKDSLSNYAHEQTVMELKISSDSKKRFSFYASIGYETNNILNGKSLSSPSALTRLDYNRLTLPGLETGVRIVRTEAFFVHDSRNAPRNTSHGGHALFGIGVFREIGGDRFGFYKVSADLRRYVRLAYNRVLVLRIAGETTAKLSGRLIPYYHLAELGEQTTIRGYRRGRFRDKDKVLTSVEYRYPIWHDTGDFMLFIDAGQVAHDIFNEFRIKDLKTGYGFGINVWGEDGIALQALAGFSSEGFRPYLVLNKAF